MSRLSNLVSKFEASGRKKITVSGHGVWMSSYAHFADSQPPTFRISSGAKYKILFYVAHGDGLGNTTGMKLDGHDYDAVPPTETASAGLDVYNYMLTPKSLKANVTFLASGNRGVAEGAYLALGSHTRFDKDLVVVANQYRFLKDIVADILSGLGHDNVDIHWAACRQVLPELTFGDIEVMQPKPFDRSRVTGKPTPAWLSGP
jgi:hypothetical protein